MSKDVIGCPSCSETEGNLCAIGSKTRGGEENDEKAEQLPFLLKTK